jgi:hypothetical protein
LEEESWSMMTNLLWSFEKRKNSLQKLSSEMEISKPESFG